MAAGAHIGVLALQGAFAEHCAVLDRLGASPREVRQAPGLAGLDGLIIPGGESTAIGKLLNALGMMEPLRRMIRDGLPVFGTCAGLILLADRLDGPEQPRPGGLDVTVRRNAFGRQVDSFETDLAVTGLDPAPFRAVFIRAPVITAVGEKAQALASARLGGEAVPVAVRQGSLLGISFHPELADDSRIHRYFLDMCERSGWKG